MSESYKQFTIQSSPFLPELLSGLLWELDILGITEEENSLRVFIDGESSLNTKIISDTLQKLVDQKLMESFSLKEEIIQSKNWNEEWEKSREVIRVSDRIVIKPTFKNYITSKDEIVLTIDPKMSFGTGEHQTTKLVLNLLERIVKKDFEVLDIGSGTGILSIAAIKLGAKYAIAVDNDELCFDNSTENCELNNVSDFVKIICGEINDVKENDFDLVIANIQKNVLLNISKSIKSKLKKNGTVILSGLLKEDEDDIVNHYSSIGFVKTESVNMNEWIALVFVYSDL